MVKLRGVAEEFLSPGLLNDYIRLATVSLAMGLVIGLSTVVVHEFYYYSHLLFEALIHTSLAFTVILPVGGITVAYALVTRYATT